jgi:predicted CoA-substrate-specific enzyme activase
VTLTLGIDVGSSYTKAVVMERDGIIAASTMIATGFRMEAAAAEALERVLHAAGRERGDIAYVVSTGQGRSQVPYRDVTVTDLTAQARGATWFFPRTRTVLDVGGQTMKATRLDAQAKVSAFRLNDKCAAGTGAFLEKTARYLGYSVDQIGALAAGSGNAAPISGVCAVFAESEVINHVSCGVAPGDIVQGAIVSLVARSVQLLKRVRIEEEVTLTGGIMRFPTMSRVLQAQLGTAVNVPPEGLVQFSGAIGAAVLGHRRLTRLASADAAPCIGAALAGGRS